MIVVDTFQLNPHKADGPALPSSDAPPLLRTHSLSCNHTLQGGASSPGNHGQIGSGLLQGTHHGRCSSSTGSGSTSPGRGGLSRRGAERGSWLGRAACRQTGKASPWIHEERSGHRWAAQSSPSPARGREWWIEVKGASGMGSGGGRLLGFYAIMPDCLCDFASSDIALLIKSFLRFRMVQHCQWLLVKNK